MGRSYFLRILLISALLALCFSPGNGRKLMTFEKENSPEENSEKRREMIEVMDYSDPGPNINPRTGYLLTPPPPPQG